MPITLMDPAGAELFTVPDGAWQSIDRRVYDVGRLRGIAQEVTQYLPEFTTLVDACGRWRQDTLPGIRSCAEVVDDYCAVALETFAELQPLLTGSITPEVEQMVVNDLNALSQLTRPLNEIFRRICDDVADFAEINRAVDDKVDAFIAQLGDEWKSILPATNRVAQAAGHVRGVWHALSADLHALVSEPIYVDDAFVASLRVKEALAGWTGLQAKAHAFANKAQTVTA